MLTNSDRYALACIKEGQRLAITPRGIQIALCVELVETNLTMYANSNDPESLVKNPDDTDKYPHDAVGSDHMSSGLFQQQPPWGPLADRMDATKSATIFFTVDNGPGVRGLTKIRDGMGRLYDYNDTSRTPGFYAQKVQGSQFPDRYDLRFNDAVALYNRLIGLLVPPDPRLALLAAVRPDFNEFANSCPNNEPRQGVPVDLQLVHTQEGAEDDDNAALDLSIFCNNSANTNNPVSYHKAVRQASDGGVTVVDMVDIGVACWAVGNSNLRSINYCFAGSDAAWTRTQWLTQSKAIDVMAYLIVRDAITVGMDPTRITFGAPNGTGYNLAPPVVSDHRYCTDFLKDGNTHVDVGDNFPADLLKVSILKYWVVANPVAIVVPPPPPPPPVLWPPGVYADAQAGPWQVLAGEPAALDVLRANIRAKAPLTLVDAFAGFLYGLITPPKTVSPVPVVPAIVNPSPVLGAVTVSPTGSKSMSKQRMEFKAGAPVVVDVKPGPVTWQDNIKKYWHLAITMVGMVLVGVTEFSPLITDPTLKSYVAVGITGLTALGVFLKNNENWVDSELTPNG
jgi:hypothetical protein